MLYNGAASKHPSSLSIYNAEGASFCKYKIIQYNIKTELNDLDKRNVNRLQDQWINLTKISFSIIHVY